MVQVLYVWMSKARSLLIEKHVVRKPSKVSLYKEGDHVLLHVNGERVSELKSMSFESGRVTCLNEKYRKTRDRLLSYFEKACLSTA